MNEDVRFNQPELVTAILRELSRQNQTATVPGRFYSLVFQLAEQIVAEANQSADIEVATHSITKDRTQ